MPYTWPVVRQFYTGKTKEDKPQKMLNLSQTQKARFGLELATVRQHHSDLDAAILALGNSKQADPMVILRLKKHKLAAKDRICELEKLLIPDILA